MTSDKELLASFRKKEIRALSRLISKAEDQDATLYPLLSELYPETGKAQVLGITGPPGAGKSSLIDQFVRFYRENSKTVAVIAVDPVSPFTGGALLGDRIRLNDHFNDDGVFIRSLSTRGKLGGLSLATREITHLVDAFGFDHVIIETVGVGQSEVDIRNIADATLVVLVPEAGDGIQTLKAGVLEIGDLFTVNKSDREGADRMVLELKTMLELAGRPKTPLLTSSQKDEASLRNLFKAVNGFFETEKALRKSRREKSAKLAAAELLDTYVAQETHAWAQKQSSAGKNPYDFLMKFRKKNPPGSLLPE